MRTNSESGPDLVLGIDVGGSFSRALVASLDGHRHGAAHGEGANPMTHPQETAAARLAEVLSDALADVNPRHIRAAVVGIAGDTALEDPDVAAAFHHVWRETGLENHPRTISDLATAFAAGTTAPHGTAVVAGTGAVAATVRDHALQTAADGHGWLLGDDGSGFWLGREAIRAALAALDGRGSPTVLTEMVVDQLLSARERNTHAYGLAQALVRAANRQPPVQLALLAPLVTRAAEQGDTVATRCVREAAGYLASSVRAAREQDATGPIVLAGSVLHPDTPVGRATAQALADQHGSAMFYSSDSAAGAAWLAALDIFGEGPEARTLHRKLVPTARA